MGCDIHLYTEKLSYSYRKDLEAWRCADIFTLDPDAISGDSEYSRFQIRRVYRDRDYTLFACLAGVRNYGNITPIDEPRGLPPDVSDYVRMVADEWGCDGHSHSYLTLGELQDAEPDFTSVPRAGMVANETAHSDATLLRYLRDTFRIVFWFDN